MRNIFFLSFLLISCSPYQPRLFDQPFSDLPQEYHQSIAQQHTNSEAQTRDWWRSFGDEDLNKLVDEVLKENLTLQAAWARLRQARERAVIAGSTLYPQVNVESQAGRRRTEVSVPFQTQFSQGVGVTYENNYSILSSLSYELDLWKRIQSGKTAAALRTESARADLENTALLLIGNVVETWFQVKEQKALHELLTEQIEASKTYLELTELRYSVGQGIALDVYRQREQLASVRSQLPPVQSTYEQALNRLALLLGRSTGNLPEIEPSAMLPDLPSFPDIVTPAMLINTRPDLKQIRFQLQASEYDLAAAVAERFPRLALSINYNFQTNDLNDLFTTEVGTLGSNIALPLIDGGRRRAEVRRQDAVVDELIANYGNAYLTALQDVENAVVQEKYQKELIARLDAQEQAAQATFTESRVRYANGITDYLQVILALQSLQNVQRRIVTEKRALLVARSRLYRALGGTWLSEITPAETAYQAASNGSDANKVNDRKG